MKISIEELDLKSLKPTNNNPRQIKKDDFEILKRSLKEFPEMQDLREIVVDENYTILGGHQRVKAMLANGQTTAKVKVTTGLTEAQKREFIIKDNIANGEWDFDVLANEWDDEPLSEWGLEVSGFEDEEEAEIEEDEAPEPPKEPRAKLGDIYQLGNSRLMCGDSTKLEDVEKLLDGQKADLVFTDPPYGMKKEKNGVTNDNLNYDDLLEFNKKWIPITFSNMKENGSWYCWGIDEPLMDIYSGILKPMIKNNEITFRNLLTWDKGCGQGQKSENCRCYAMADEKCIFVMKGVQGFNTNADNYFEGFEPIRIYLKNEAEKVGLCDRILKQVCGVSMYAHWFSKSQWAFIPEQHYKKIQQYYNGEAFKKEYDELKKEYDELKKEYYSTRAFFDNTHDNMNDVWHFERTVGEEREDAGGHATPKPIALCSRAIKSSSREGEKVLDVFGGSGSTLITCEKLNRNAYLMELEPKWVDVIIARWEKYTGKKAILLNRG